MTLTCATCGQPIHPENKTGRCRRCAARQRWILLKVRQREERRRGADNRICIDCGKALNDRRNRSGRCSACYGRQCRADPEGTSAAAPPPDGGGDGSGIAHALDAARGSAELNRRQWRVGQVFVGKFGPPPVSGSPILKPVE